MIDFIKYNSIFKCRKCNHEFIDSTLIKAPINTPEAWNPFED